MCVYVSTDEQSFLSGIRRAIRHRLSRLNPSKNSSLTPSSSLSSPRSWKEKSRSWLHEKPLPESPRTRMISSPTGFYKDPSGNAAISMSKLTEDQSSYVQSISSTSGSSPAGSKPASFKTVSVRAFSFEENEKDREILNADAEANLQLKELPRPNAELPAPPQLAELKGGAANRGRVDGEKERLSVMEPNVGGGFVDGLQLKGARVSTMFKGLPWLQEGAERL